MKDIREVRRMPDEKRARRKKPGATGRAHEGKAEVLRVQVVPQTGSAEVKSVPVAPIVHAGKAKVRAVPVEGDEAS
jgi:hypothetical protein